MIAVLLVAAAVVGVGAPAAQVLMVRARAAAYRREWDTPDRVPAPRE